MINLELTSIGLDANLRLKEEMGSLGSWIVLGPIHKGGREGGLEEAWLGAFKWHATLTLLAILIGLDANLVTCLDYGEEAHRLRIPIGWSNMTGYKTGSSPAKVYTTAKTSPVENFKYGWRNDMVVNMATILFVKGVFSQSYSLSYLKPSTKYLASGELHP